jgi:uncharacterized protein (TIGR03435 family)
MVVSALNYSFGEDNPKGLAFEVASITPCKPGTAGPPMEHAGMVQFTYPGGLFRANATTLQYLIEWSYGIQPSQHSGGPEWMGSDRYDVVAKAEGNATDPEMKLMVQTLLAERFKLKFHREQRSVSAYVVGVGKTPTKLTPAKQGEAHAIRIVPQMGPDQKVQSYRVAGTRYALAQLFDVFARQLDTVIVDKTGLDGEYDFTLELSPDETRPNPLDAGILLSAMREQLGLTLQSQKTPVDFVVIDSAEKVLAGNE